MKNWSLSKKIWSVLGILCLAFIASSALGLNDLLKGRASLDEITESLVKRDHLTAQMQDNQRLALVATQRALLQTDAAALKMADQNFADAVAEQAKDIKTYHEIASPEGKELLKKYEKSYDQFLEAAKKSRAFAEQGNSAQGVIALFSADKAIDAMRESVDAMNKLTSDRLQVVSKEAESRANRSIWVNVIVSTFSILASLLTAFFVLRALTRSIREIVSNLFDSSAQVSSAAGQIASSSEELSQATTEQAASLEETAASIEQMNSMVGKNSENADSAASSSDVSQKKAEHGKAVVLKMVNSMEDINKSNSMIMEQVSRSNESIAGIVKVIEEIGNKTKVINDIVFQTKLLSFNASVEAARAGEHGKGFAVVAEEVGNLAQMSGNAAKEISTLLEESVHKVNEIVEETNSSVEKLIAECKETVENGGQVARQCGEVLDEIVQDVSKVSAMAGEIASASQEQSRGVGEITKAMNQLDQMTQQNAATSEECASAAEELSAQSVALKKAVNLLVMTVNGTDSHGDLLQNHMVEPAAPPKKVPSHPQQNVVQLKSENRKPLRSPVQPLKKASSGAPEYNNAGFEEI